MPRNTNEQEVAHNDASKQSFVFDEEAYEKTLIALFQDMGYRTVCGYDYPDRDYTQAIWRNELAQALERLNPKLGIDYLREAENSLTEYKIGTLVDRNEAASAIVKQGFIPITLTHHGEQRTENVRIMDYENIDNNSFVCANQWSFTEGQRTRRPDIVLFVNGLPLVVIELKSPSRENTDVGDGYRQIQDYIRDIPNFFVYNQICAISDMTTSKAGTITSNAERFMAWKSKDGITISQNAADYETFFKGLFERKRLMDIIENFTCYCVEGTQKYKILAGYHQYFAVRKAVYSTIRGIETNHKAGVFWHTQGSGKSLSMVFYAHLLQKTQPGLTLVVVTDRNDLDNQLFHQFLQCKNFLRQTPEQADSRKSLEKLLEDRLCNGIFFSTMQRFLERSKPFSDRKDIVVMADEAHRGQYGLVEKITKIKQKDGSEIVRVVVGDARKVRSCLPNATYIGFTGTPIDSTDHNTREVFGEYIDIYDMTRAVADGATRPIYYENRVIRLNLRQDIIEQIDREYDVLANEKNDSEASIEKSKQALGSMASIFRSKEALDSLTSDILDHYENHRQHLLTGKAMIVAYDRVCAVGIYQRILAAHPDWTEKVHVVMTGSHGDPPEWDELTGTAEYRRSLGTAFKNNASPFKIAIVVDMWLTGFDVPSLATLYLSKPMVSHNLMQAIARVNRVYEDKEGGLVVDYIGIATALKQAMRDYTQDDQKAFSNSDIGTMAKKEFETQLDVCKSLLYGYDYSAFFTQDNRKMAHAIAGAVNYLNGPSPELQKKREDFLKHALLLKKACSLCASILKYEQRLEASFMETVRVTITRLESPHEPGSTDIDGINKRVTELIHQSVKSEGVVQLFDMGDEYLDLFDPAFLKKVLELEHKNIALQILKRIIEEQVRLYSRTNNTLSEKFSDRINRILDNYSRGMSTCEEVIRELAEIAKEIRQAEEEGKKLNLSPEEKAFYDALAKPENIREFLSDAQLIQMAKELNEKLRAQRTVDWHKKENVRARMQQLVRIYLHQHGYPPRNSAATVDSVLHQCEIWADNQDYSTNG